MTFTLWLSADEEQILERIMRAEGTYSKQQAVIAAIKDKGAQLAAEFQAGSTAIGGVNDQDGEAFRTVVEAP
jgi:hypothetical protein